jgi:hypothetical protein
MANVEQVIIKDSGGVEADVTAGNALKVDGSGVTQPVSGTVTINAIPSGTNNIGDVDVLTLPALPAGTNNIGDVDIASIAAGDNNIGNVDIVTLPALVAGSAIIGKVGIDQTTPGTTNGVQVNAALPAGTNNIGDVDVLTLPADPLGANADAVVAAGATGSISAKLRRTTQGLEDLKTGIVLAAGANNIGDVDVLTLPSIPAGTNNIGDIDVLTLPADPLGANADAVVAAGAAGSISAKLRRISQGVEDLKTGITALPSHAVTNAGTFAVQATLAAETTKVIGTVNVAASQSIQAIGDIAHDAGDSGNPVKTGAKAHTALPTAVANNDRTNNVSDVWGRLLTSHIDPAMQVAITKTAFNATTTQTGAAMWTPAAGKKIALTSLTISTYGTTGARVIIWIGASGDTTYTAGTDHAVVIASFSPSATVKPGLVFTPAVPIFSQTADHILRITTDAGISIDVTWNGYEF